MKRRFELFVISMTVSVYLFISTVLKVNIDYFLTEQHSLQLALYRHWTVESSLRYTMFTAIALKLWAIRGEKRLYQLLAEMG